VHTSAKNNSQRTYTIKPHHTANDPLSQRIFKGDDLPAALQPAETLISLHSELEALQQENDALQRSLQLSGGLRQRFETLFDEYPLGLLSLDEEQHIVEANLTLANLLHMDRAQLIGQPLRKIIDPQEHSDFLPQLNQEHNQKNTPCEHGEVTLMTAQQTPVKVHIESTMLHASAYNNAILHCRISPLQKTEPPQHLADLAISNAKLQKEINEREQAEEQSRRHQEELAHAARLKTMGEMASGLAHEINQPLTAIHSYAKSCLRLLKGDADKQAQVPFILEHVGKQAQRAASIVQHLRDFVSKNASHRQATELNHVVQLAVRMMHSEFKKHDISLEIETPSNLPTINADAIQLEQVLINLMRNACEAMAADSGKPHQLKIEIDKPEENFVRIAISDTGPGIEADSAEKIDTPFFTTKTNGMGLGLAISRTIVEDHGGKLTHENNANGGATFFFTLAIDGRPSQPEN
jgi:phosphoglycerate-specific signal transduction histidine kinase